MVQSPVFDVLVDPAVVEETQADQVAGVVRKLVYILEVEDETFGVVFQTKAESYSTLTR